jgi:putative hydrolase of the HAD superfamily
VTAVNGRFRAVLFDFAGTLFMPVAPETMMTAALERIGLELAAEERDRLAAEYARVGIAGGPYPSEVPEALTELYAQRDLSAENHRRAYVGLLSEVSAPTPELAEVFYEELLRFESWVPYAEAAAVLDALTGAGITVGLISNVGFDLRPILRGNGFAALAERLTLSYEVGVAKPDTDIFAAALRTLGSQAQDTLMVGDNAEADDGGVALGMPTLLLPMTPPGSRHGLEAVLGLAGAGGRSEAR